MKKKCNALNNLGERESAWSEKEGVRRETVKLESLKQESSKTDKQTTDRRQKDIQPAGLRQTSEGTGGRLGAAYQYAFQQSMADAPERAMDLCDVRLERVVRVKRATEAGTYWVPAGELAQKLVGIMLGDHR
jgi:anti-sigma28 factor (negative regulator of flagellin synthesis)